jgi:BASS family bile acid:Na+ symporter
MLGQTEQLLVLFSMFILMVGMGSTLSLADFKRVLRHPGAMFGGCFIQFFCMPGLAYLIATQLELSPQETLALLMVGCSPGGTSSNMYTWFARGHVALSISMTFCSTLMAIVLMPTLVSLLASQSDIGIVIPFKNISGSLLFVLIPIGIGLALRHRSFRYLTELQRLGGILGVLATVLMLYLWLPRMWAQFLESYSSSYLAIFLLGLSGFSLGYLMGRMLGFSERMSRTISLETGLQNTLLTFTILTVSFPADFVEQVAWIPLVYGAAIMGMGAVVVGMFRLRRLEVGQVPSDQAMETVLTDWEVFVLRHKNPYNVAIHVVSFLMFWSGPLLWLISGDWPWLFLTMASGSVGTFGHWVTKDSHVSFKEATHSLAAVRYSSKMSLLALMGQYTRVVAAVEAKTATTGESPTSQTG